MVRRTGLVAGALLGLALVGAGCASEEPATTAQSGPPATKGVGAAVGDSLELGEQVSLTLEGTEQSYAIDPEPGAILTVTLENAEGSKDRVQVELTANGEQFLQTDNVSPGGDAEAVYTLSAEDEGEDFRVVIPAATADIELEIDARPQRDGGIDGDAPAEESDARSLSGEQAGRTTGTTPGTTADGGDGGGETTDDTASGSSGTTPGTATDGPDSRLPGHLGGNDRNDWYSVELDGGAVVSLPFANDQDSGGRIFVELWHEGEQLERITVPAGGDEVIERTLGADEGGEYLIGVEGDDKAEIDYTFAVDAGGQDDCGSGGDAPEENSQAIDIAVGDRCTGQTGDTDQTDLYGFEVTAGTTLEIGIENDPDSGGRVFVTLSLNGTRVKNETVGPGGSATITHDVTEDQGGTAILEVRGERTTDYAFTVSSTDTPAEG